ncbi:hypothetical protein LCGC14_2896450, partial [marine sediment metagenome]
VRRYQKDGRDLVDTSTLPAMEPAVQCGDCLLAIRVDILKDFYQLSRDISVEFGPHNSKEDGPIPERYQAYFDKSAKDLLEAYPFPEYVQAQGTWPKPENEE